MNDEKTAITISLYNPKIMNNGLGVYIKYNRLELPYLTIWKFFRRRAYVLGIEPGTCHVEGRLKEKERVKYLDSDESFKTSLEIGVIE